MRKILTIVSLLLALAASADEGMWTLFNLPQAIRERMRLYGCQLSDEALTTTLPSAVVNFSGFCTGEVVSPNGLLMTNHHCGFEAVRRHSTTEHDYLLHGFVADSLTDELPCEGLFVAFMLSQQDVTDTLRALGAMDYLIDALERAEIIDSLEEQMTKAARQRDSSCYVEINAFYEGNAYYATTFRRYDDIRLVMAPPKSLGKFGGELDNWMWPRQTCDFSVFRIYSDGKPLNTPSYLPVCTEGYKEGDYAMVMGYPGSTERYLSSYGIQQMRDCVNEPMSQVRGVKQKIMRRHMDRSAAVRIKYDSKYAQSSNYWKNAIGMNKCIDSIGLIRQKQEYEQKLSQWYVQHGDTADVTPGLSELKSLYARQHSAMRAYTLFTESFTRRSNNEFATRAYRYCDGMPVKGKENRPRKQYVQFDDNSNTYDRDLDIEVLAALMSNYREQIGTDSFLPSFYKVVDSLYGGDYKAYVTYLWDHSILMTSERIPLHLPRRLRRDPGVEFSYSLMETLGDIRLQLDEMKDSIALLERKLCYCKLRYEEDQPHYSDANFTMRLSYGQVGGYRLPDYDSGYMTTPQSLLNKAAMHDEWLASCTDFTAPNPYAEYFLEPEVRMLMQGADQAEGTEKPFGLCFLTNNDITGGNSGSPVIDGKGRLIGLAFDGTWDSLSSDIYFDTTLARCIAVDIRYVLYIVKHWAHAARLIEEMEGEKN